MKPAPPVMNTFMRPPAADRSLCQVDPERAPVWSPLLLPDRDDLFDPIDRAGLAGILIAIAAFFLFAVLGLTGSTIYLSAMKLVMLQPSLLLREPWTLLTYSFVPTGLVSVLFATLSLWFFGSVLEDERRLDLSL